MKASEKGIATGITTAGFAQKASIAISADQSREILQKMGINIPARINTSDITRVIEQTPKLTSTQIETFYKEASKIKIDAQK